MSAYENPMDEMKIEVKAKNKAFKSDSDIVLLCLVHRLGYGMWADVKRAIRKESRCRFDHWFLSRTEQELARRVDFLVKILD